MDSEHNIQITQASSQTCTIILPLRSWLPFHRQLIPIFTNPRFTYIPHVVVSQESPEITITFDGRCGHLVTEEVAFDRSETYDILALDLEGRVTNRSTISAEGESRIIISTIGPGAEQNELPRTKRSSEVTDWTILQRSRQPSPGSLSSGAPAGRYDNGSDLYLTTEGLLKTSGSSSNIVSDDICFKMCERKKVCSSRENSSIANSDKEFVVEEYVPSKCFQVLYGGVTLSYSNALSERSDSDERLPDSGVLYERFISTYVAEPVPIEIIPARHIDFDLSSKRDDQRPCSSSSGSRDKMSEQRYLKKNKSSTSFNSSKSDSELNRLDDLSLALPKRKLSKGRTSKLSPNKLDSSGESLLITGSKSGIELGHMGASASSSETDSGSAYLMCQSKQRLPSKERSIAKSDEGFSIEEYAPSKCFQVLSSGVTLAYCNAESEYSESDGSLNESGDACKRFVSSFVLEPAPFKIIRVGHIDTDTSSEGEDEVPGSSSSGSEAREYGRRNKSTSGYSSSESYSEFNHLSDLSLTLPKKKFDSVSSALEPDRKTRKEKLAEMILDLLPLPEIVLY